MAHDVGVYIGAILATFLVSRLFWLATRRWPNSAGKALAINAICGVLFVLLASIGFADGGPPKVAYALAIYVPCQLAVLIFDLTRIWMRKDTLPAQQ